MMLIICSIEKESLIPSDVIIYLSYLGSICLIKGILQTPDNVLLVSHKVLVIFTLFK